MSQVAIAIVHGIGEQKRNFADQFITKLQDEFARIGGNYDDLVFEPICWQEAVQPIEDRLYYKVRDLGWSSLRRLFVNYAGDALAYQPNFFSEEGFYKSVHEVLDNRLKNLRNKVDSNTPLCIINHSLGSVISSNFVWDCQHPSSSGNNCYHSSPESIDLVNRLRLFISMGSPLTVWSLRFENGGTPISVDEWINIYSRNDIISSPLQNINQHYNRIVTDIHLKVGSFFTSWSPLSHNEYWTDKNTIRHIISNIKKLTSI